MRSYKSGIGERERSNTEEYSKGSNSRACKRRCKKNTRARYESQRFFYFRTSWRNLGNCNGHDKICKRNSGRFRRFLSLYPFSKHTYLEQSRKIWTRNNKTCKFRLESIFYACKGRNAERMEN